MTTTTTTSHGNIETIHGAKDLKKFIAEMNQLMQQIREEYLRDIQQPAAVLEQQAVIFPRKTSWTLRADLCRVDHASFVYKRTGLPQFSTFLQNEEKLNEALEQLECLRRMLVTNKQQKKTGIRKIHDIIKLVRQQESQDQRLPSPTFDFVTTMSTGDDDDDADYHNEFLLEADDSTIVKALKAQLETTKQNHRTISRNLLLQVNSIMKAVRHYILDVKRSAEDNVGEIIHHAEKCRAFIAKCVDYTVLDYCAYAWWHETQKDAMDDAYYHLEVETVNPDDTTFNPSAVATTENYLRICVYNGNTINPAYLAHVYDYDQDLAQAIYTEETFCEVQKIIRHFNRANVVATCEA